MEITSKVLPISIVLIAFLTFMMGIGQFIPDVSMIRVAMSALLSFSEMLLIPDFYHHNII